MADWHWEPVTDDLLDGLPPAALAAARRVAGELSACDAQYVALAEALHVPLITADARIKRSGAARCEIEVFDAHT